MKKDLIFFGEQGLTQTSANHIANLAKEVIAQYEATFNGLSFIDVEAQLIGTNTKNTLNKGVQSIESFENTLMIIAKYKSLIAWFREAIKAKQRLYKEVEDLDTDEYAKKKGIEIPEYPKEESTITEDDYLSTLSIKERNRYYYLETVCSTIGKQIHPDGEYSRARRELLERQQKPHQLRDSGRDAIIYHYTPSISYSMVDDLFNRLQKLHREYQAELNSMKFEMEKAIKADKLNKEIEFNKKYCAYSEFIQNLQNELSLYKLEKCKEIDSFKIVIPNDLQQTYEAVKALGK